MGSGYKDPECDATNKHDRNEVQSKEVPADSVKACQFNKECATPC